MPRRTRKPARPTQCPCGSGETYAACCGRFHTGAAAAPTAEALMRSRYSAFAVGDEPYLLRTWHPGTRPDRLDLAADARTWTGLDILDTTGGTRSTPPAPSASAPATPTPTAPTPRPRTAPSNASAAPGCTSTPSASSEAHSLASAMTSSGVSALDGWKLRHIGATTLRSCCPSVRR
nr:hypothetical protein GCM10025732_50570 [Glycomyces mayteni]